MGLSENPNIPAPGKLRTTFHVVKIVVKSKATDPLPASVAVSASCFKQPILNTFSLRIKAVRPTHKWSVTDDRAGPPGNPSAGVPGPQPGTGPARYRAGPETCVRAYVKARYRAGPVPRPR